MESLFRKILQAIGVILVIISAQGCLTLNYNINIKDNGKADTVKIYDMSKIDQKNMCFHEHNNSGESCVSKNGITTITMKDIDINESFVKNGELKVVKGLFKTQYDFNVSMFMVVAGKNDKFSIHDIVEIATLGGQGHLTLTMPGVIQPNSDIAIQDNAAKIDIFKMAIDQKDIVVTSEAYNKVNIIVAICISLALLVFLLFGIRKIIKSKKST